MASIGGGGRAPENWSSKCTNVPVINDITWRSSMKMTQPYDNEKDREVGLYGILLKFFRRVAFFPETVPVRGIK